jgi:hypothetical protein
MNRHSQLVAALGCVATLATVGCANNGAITPQNSISQQAPSNAFSGPGWIEKNGVLYHVPHYALPRRMAAQRRFKPNTQLAYGNGPVLVAPKAYLILWGYQTYGDPYKVGKLLQALFRNQGGSSHNNIYTQYYMVAGSITTYITNPTNQYGGVWDDETNPVPYNATDAQVAAEALNGVAQFGYDPNGSYIVAMPYGHDPQGFGPFYCAYHGSTVYNGQYVSYTNLPYMPDGGRNCGAYDIGRPSDERAIDEGVTILEGHEYGESITDPVPNTGWTDSNGDEIGDLCEWIDIANDPFNAKSYTMQPMFSNATSTCVQSY